MIIMNGFPIGFFFPKRDFVQPLVNDERERTKVEHRQKDDDVAHEVEATTSGLSLYAYRFF
ncbi:hypothetical protein JJB09_10635 [Rhizobium sp. KVB221]|uniref:Uncharacterized protein n=1 Tax=Rhizobium setariae TaxID=2801340 RepID=A0A937CKT7_9HYPH|nr:hypothetical protein [Rhizobium setariae]MBL0372485.1 hypothetical protein [Rhizobium setariae]